MKLKAILLLILLALPALAAETPKPKLSDADAIKIRDAQVVYMTARANLDKAQANLDAAVSAAMDHAKADPKDYWVTDVPDGNGVNHLELVEVPKPKAEKAPEKK